LLSTLFVVDQRNAQYYANDTDGHLGCITYYTVWARYHWSERYSGRCDVFDPHLPAAREDRLAQAMYTDERECVVLIRADYTAHSIRSGSFDLYTRRSYRVSRV